MDGAAAAHAHVASGLMHVDAPSACTGGSASARAGANGDRGAGGAGRARVRHRAGRRSPVCAPAVSARAVCVCTVCSRAVCARERVHGGGAA